MKNKNYICGLKLKKICRQFQCIMNPRVKDVIPAKDYTLHLWFKNGEEGIFDMKPYLDCNMFRPLRDINMFNTVRPAHGTIRWINDADLCPDTVYLESKKI